MMKSLPLPFKKKSQNMTWVQIYTSKHTKVRKGTEDISPSLVVTVLWYQGQENHNQPITGLLERITVCLPSGKQCGCIHFFTYVVSFDLSLFHFKPTKESEWGIRGIKELGGLPKRTGKVTSGNAPVSFSRRPSLVVVAHWQWTWNLSKQVWAMSP